VFVGPVVLAIAWELLAAWTRDGAVVGVEGASRPLAHRD